MVLVLPTVQVRAEDGYDLRKVRWGMSPEQVDKTEKGMRVYQDPRLLVYSTEVLGRRMSIEYQFAGNRLYRAVYILSEDYLIERKYLQDFLDFKNVLTTKYGQPVRDEMVWHKPYMKNDPSQWGVAVSIGHLSCDAVWETEATKIAAFLTGGNYAVSCQIVYSSKALAHLAGPGGEQGENGGAASNPQLQKALEAF